MSVDVLVLSLSLSSVAGEGDVLPKATCSPKMYAVSLRVLLSRTCSCRVHLCSWGSRLFCDLR